MAELDDKEFLKAVVSPRSTIVFVAKYTCDLLIFYAFLCFGWVELELAANWVVLC